MIRRKRQLGGWPGVLPIGPCFTSKGVFGHCTSFRKCYPYFKLPELSNWETWILGMYDTCSYFTPSGRQMFGVCCTNPGNPQQNPVPTSPPAIAAPEEPPSTTPTPPSRPFNPSNPAVPVGWPPTIPPIPTHPPDHTAATHPPIIGAPQPPLQEGPSPTLPPPPTPATEAPPPPPTAAPPRPPPSWPPPFITHPPAQPPSGPSPPTRPPIQWPPAIITHPPVQQPGPPGRPPPQWPPQAPTHPPPKPPGPPVHPPANWPPQAPTHPPPKPPGPPVQPPAQWPPQAPTHPPPKPPAPAPPSVPQWPPQAPTHPPPVAAPAPPADPETVPLGDASCGAKNGFQDQERIVGGVNADLGEWPWIAALFNGGRQFCGGSLIDSTHILTAAHCVAHMSSWDVARLSVKLGDHNIKTNTEIRHVEKKVQRVVRHRGFDSRTLYNDVAILTLDSPVTFTQQIRPICLPAGSSSLYNGVMATVIGWGSLKEGGTQPAILQKVNIPIWTNQECKAKYGNAAPGGIVEHFLCAGQASRDSCSGDSGGPLMINQGRWTQVGIVSWGIGCGKGQYPGVYTRVTYFMAWITKNLK